MGVAEEYAIQRTRKMMDLLAAMLDENDIDVWEKEPEYPCHWMLCTTHEPQKRTIPALRSCINAMRIASPRMRNSAKHADFQVILFTPEGRFACTGNGALLDEDGEEIEGSDAFTDLKLS